MDSLMMLELRMTIEDTLNIELPMISLASGVTPIDVAKRLVALLRSESPSNPTVPSNIVAMSTSHFADDAVSSTPEEQQAAVRAVMLETQRLKGPL